MFQNINQPKLYFLGDMATKLAGTELWFQLRHQYSQATAVTYALQVWKYLRNNMGT